MSAGIMQYIIVTVRKQHNSDHVLTTRKSVIIDGKVIIKSEMYCNDDGKLLDKRR